MEEKRRVMVITHEGKPSDKVKGLLAKYEPGSEIEYASSYNLLPLVPKEVDIVYVCSSLSPIAVGRRENWDGAYLRQPSWNLDGSFARFNNVSLDDVCN